MPSRLTAGDDESGQSPVGAARAESDEDDEDTANERRREELDGSLIVDISS
jgi:hypothetical protein